MDLERRMQAADSLDKRLVTRAIALDANAATTPQQAVPKAAAPHGMLTLPALPDSVHTDGTVRDPPTAVIALSSYMSGVLPWCPSRHVQACTPSCKEQLMRALTTCCRSKRSKVQRPHGRDCQKQASRPSYRALRCQVACTPTLAQHLRWGEVRLLTSCWYLHDLD
jgi:hypothetical protein